MKFAMNLSVEALRTKKSMEEKGYRFEMEVKSAPGHYGCWFKCLAFFQEEKESIGIGDSPQEAFLNALNAARKRN